MRSDLPGRLVTLCRVTLMDMAIPVWGGVGVTCTAACTTFPATEALVSGQKRLLCLQVYMETVSVRTADV